MTLATLFSRNAILALYKSSESEGVIANFKKLHAYRNLSGLLDSLFEEHINMPEEFVRTKLILFSYTRPHYMSLLLDDYRKSSGREGIFMMDVTESKAMVDRVQGITNQLKKSSLKILILSFPGRESWHLIEQLRYFIDGYFGSLESKSDKKVIFLALYNARDFSQG